ncbi:MAG: antitoxin ParD1/3/4 [Halioglobus sp.]|jgi:antitoxin ParD1/3/4
MKQFSQTHCSAKTVALNAFTRVLISNTFIFRYKHVARNTSVTLGDHFETFITSKIEQGHFQSVSEAVRAGLRKLEEDEARLEALRLRLQAGEDRAVTENFDSRKFLEKLHKKHLG